MEEGRRTENRRCGVIICRETDVPGTETKQTDGDDESAGEERPAERGASSKNSKTRRTSSAQELKLPLTLFVNEREFPCELSPSPEGFLFSFTSLFVCTCDPLRRRTELPACVDIFDNAR